MAEKAKAAKLRVLILHSRYLSGSVSGENRVVEDEARLLREDGHEVHLYDPEPVQTGRATGPRNGLNAIWARSHVDHVRNLLVSRNFDVVHCHNLFWSLSPGVISAAKQQDVPVAMTLHNYRLSCLPGTFFRDGRVCEDCCGRSPISGVVHRCFSDSILGSAAMAASLVTHRRLGTFDKVDLFFAISEFMRRKHIQMGFDPQKISVKPNFVWPTRRREGPGGFYLYAGRLSSEKGVDILLDTFASLEDELVIAGSGPEESVYRHRATPNVRFLGGLAPKDLERVVSEARAVLVPSRWHEGFGRTVVEAYAAGTPVITSSEGALPELVEDGRSGVLVSSLDPREWTVAVERLRSDGMSLECGARAYSIWRERFTPRVAAQRLVRMYLETIHRKLR